MKRGVATYVVVAVLVGLLGTPLAVSLAWVALTVILAVVAEAGSEAVTAIVVALVVSGALALPFARWSRRPASWRSALMPVAVAPAGYLLAWIVAFGTSGLAFGETLRTTWLTHAPYLLLQVGAQLMNIAPVVPAVLVAVLAGTLAGFLLGCRGRQPTGRRWLSGVLAGSLVLVGTGLGQLAQAGLNARALEGTPVSMEVDLTRYRPFEAGNALVVPAQTPDLAISSAFPVLDGATAAYPVYAAMGQAVYRLPEGATEQSRSDFVDRYVACSNTRQAYQGLVDGTVDVFFGAQPSAAQRQAAKDAGRELVLTPIAREAFVVFVNQSNPVSALTTGQIQDIYTGRLTNWNQLGGPDQAIVAFQRPEGSGSQTVMESTVMKDRTMTSPLKEELVEGMGGIVSQVADYRNAPASIGYSFRWYATVMNGNPGIKLLAVDGVEPTPENIRNGSYPFTVDVYAATAGTKNANAGRLVDWLVSAQGQGLVEQVGYIGVG